VARGPALDVTNLLGEAEGLALQPLFSWPAPNLEPPHSLRF
jgi:hypothetical protein